MDKKRDKYPESASLGWRRTQHRCSQTARHRFRREEAAARTLPVRALGPRGQPGPAAACRPRRARPGDDGPQGTSPQASEGRNASHADPGLGRTRLVIALAESISTSIPFISRSVSFNWYQNKQARDPGSLPADHPASRDPPPPTHTHTEHQEGQGLLALPARGSYGNRLHRDGKTMSSSQKACIYSLIKRHVHAVYFSPDAVP